MVISEELQIENDPPVHLPDITANNDFNGTNESEETIKDNNEGEKNNEEMEIVEIDQNDHQPADENNMDMEVDEGQEKAKENVTKRKDKVSV